SSSLVARGVPELRLSGLANYEARELLAERLGPGASPAAIEWVADNANGNPLALVELPRSLSPGQLTGHEPLAGALPPTTSVERAFPGGCARLRGRVGMVLGATAAESMGDRGTIARAATELGLDPEGLAAAEAAGLVRVDAERVEFRHPLMRSAVYRGASFA